MIGDRRYLTELARMGEPITDRRCKDICLQGYTSEYKNIKLMMMYRDPTFDRYLVLEL